MGSSSARSACGTKRRTRRPGCPWAAARRGAAAAAAVPAARKVRRRISTSSGGGGACCCAGGRAVNEDRRVDATVPGGRSMPASPDLSAMPLYTSLDRIERGLAALGIGPADPIPPDKLFALDQMHYHGTDAVRRAAELLGLGPGSRVLDIGSGFGGPARWLAHVVGCQVTAVEVQPALDSI